MKTENKTLIEIEKFCAEQNRKREWWKKFRKDLGEFFVGLTYLIGFAAALFLFAAAIIKVIEFCEESSQVPALREQVQAIQKERVGDWEDWAEIKIEVETQKHTISELTEKVKRLDEQLNPPPKNFWKTNCIFLTNSIRCYAVATNVTGFSSTNNQ